jgi:hypothetical protein
VSEGNDDPALPGLFFLHPVSGTALPAMAMTTFIGQGGFMDCAPAVASNLIVLVPVVYAIAACVHAGY